MNDRPIHHIAYVVDDLPTAVDRWVDATGAGPFIHLGDHVTFEELLLDGEPAVFDHASAIGPWGPIFLELIQLHEVTPSLAEHLPGGASKVAHVAHMADDLDAETQRLEAAGMPRFLQQRQGPVRISVFDAPLLGHAVEVLERSDAIEGLFAFIASGSDGWDGTNPLRPMPEG